MTIFHALIIVLYVGSMTINIYTRRIRKRKEEKKIETIHN